jgi:hypothetical protein
MACAVRNWMNTPRNESPLDPPPAVTCDGDARIHLVQWNQFSRFFGSVCSDRDLVVEVIGVRVAMFSKHDPGESVREHLWVLRCCERLRFIFLPSIFRQGA